VALILDTNALSAVADGEASVLELVGGADRVAVPVIVLGEYRFGIAQSRHRVSYEGWLRQWIAAVEILDIDDRSIHSYSTIALELKRKGSPIPTNDLWIAALCRQHSLPLLSRDKHFDSVPGLQRLDW
jgi:predicted nucleic acid-binding protein